MIWDRFYYYCWTQLPVNQGPKFSKSRIMLVQLLWWQMLIHYCSTCHWSTFEPWSSKNQCKGSQAPYIHQREVSLGLEEIKLKRFKTSLVSRFSQIVCLFSTPVFRVVNSDALCVINLFKFEYKHCTQISRWCLQNKTVSPPLVLIHQDQEEPIFTTCVLKSHSIHCSVHRTLKGN